MACSFCENQSIQERLIYRDTLAQVFPTNMPIVPGHVLICPVRCVPKMQDLTSEELRAIQKLLVATQDALQKVFGAQGFNCAWNEGEVSGQSVPHFHLHVLPRTLNDGGVVEYEPRSFLYRPGSREISPENELQAIAAKVRPYLLM